MPVSLISINWGLQAGVLEAATAVAEAQAALIISVLPSAIQHINTSTVSSDSNGDNFISSMCAHAARSRASLNTTASASVVCPHCPRNLLRPVRLSAKRKLEEVLHLALWTEKKLNARVPLSLPQLLLVYYVPTVHAICSSQCAPIRAYSRLCAYAPMRMKEWKNERMNEWMIEWWTGWKNGW